MNRLPARWHAPVWLVMQAGSLGGVVAATTRSKRVGMAGATAWVAAKAVKPFVGRARPASARVLGREQSGLGYPSGHAAVAAAMAYTGPSRAAWLLAGVVGASRMYVGAHLPLDVAGGAALGVACAAAVELVSPPTPVAAPDAGRGRRRRAARR